MPQIECLVTAGNLDPAGPPLFENNTWLIGDENEVLVIDPAHDAEAVAAAVGDRKLVAIVCTHGHWDHVRAAPGLAAKFDAIPVRLGEPDRFLWEQSHGGAPVTPLVDGESFQVAGIELQVLATPGHTPGSSCLYAPQLAALFTGDTLFEGGPGATRWDYSDFEQILESIETKLLSLPPATSVNTGHGSATTIGAEAPQLEIWRNRGW